MRLTFIHGMGDIHPPEPKLTLLEKLARFSPWPMPKLFCLLEAQTRWKQFLKTAALARASRRNCLSGSLPRTHRGHRQRRDIISVRSSRKTIQGVSFAPFPDPQRLLPHGQASSEAVGLRCVKVHQTATRSARSSSSPSRPAVASGSRPMGL